MSDTQASNRVVNVTQDDVIDLHNNEIVTEEAAIQTALDTADSLFKSFVNSTIVFYWSIGEILASLDRKYGTNSIENFSKQLAARKERPVEIDKSTLYKALKFYQTHNKNDRDKMIAAGISWTQIQRTLSADPVIVANTIDRVVEGLVEPARFAEAVKQVQDGGETAAEAKQRQQNEMPSETPEDLLGSSHGLVRCLQTNIKNLDSLLESMPDLFIIFEEKWENLPNEEKKKQLPLVQELRDRLNSLRSVGGKLFESVTKTLS